ncbi:MAG: hypothetical protein U5R06_16385 [candidate division KSB1 bacterium]|nr:hypothetical protein [candidate division KSB1 bacterium]
MPPIRREPLTGTEKEFTTLDSIAPPTVFTGAVSNILVHSAECRGFVIDWGGDSLTARGMVWNTTGDPTLDDHNTRDGTEIGEFISFLHHLEQSTTYYVRAYAVNSAGAGYGAIRDFTTQAPQRDVVKVVDPNGNGDYTTVQAAFNDVPNHYTGLWKIKVKLTIFSLDAPGRTRRAPFLSALMNRRR